MHPLSPIRINKHSYQITGTNHRYHGRQRVTAPQITANQMEILVPQQYIYASEKGLQRIYKKVFDGLAVAVPAIMHAADLDSQSLVSLLDVFDWRRRTQPELVIG